MGIKAALEELNNKVKDLSSLHVQTYSGTLDIGIDNDDKFSKLEESLAAASGEISLSMETLMHFDGDSYTFVTDGISPELQKVHNDAVQAGINARKGLMDMVVGWIK